MAFQILQDILDSIQSGADWVLRTFLAVLLRCLGILLKAVFRPEDGYCFEGPCTDRSLARIALEFRDGDVYWME